MESIGLMTAKSLIQPHPQAEKSTFCAKNPVGNRLQFAVAPARGHVSASMTGGMEQNCVPAAHAVLFFFAERT